VYCTQSLDSLYFVVFLFFCGNTQPKQNEEYVSANCTQQAFNTITVPNSLANHDYALWAPPIGTQGPSANGWYIGCEFVQATDTHNGQTRTKEFWRTGAPLLKG
jgi:hypothetical protein